MSTSEKFLLLSTCFLLLTITTGVVHASGCTPDPTVGACITTDKATYSPGDAVNVTVNVLAKLFPGNLTKLPFAVEIVPVGTATYDVAIAPLTLTGPSGGGTLDTGSVELKLPTNTTAGHYDIRIDFCEKVTVSPPDCIGEYTMFQGATTGITVTGQKPVPETRSALLLLLPALLIGLYVVNRRRLTKYE
jgi:hypothetical protein